MWNTGRILAPKYQSPKSNVTKSPKRSVTDIDYEFADESDLMDKTPLPPINKIQGAEPSSWIHPKTSLT